MFLSPLLGSPLNPSTSNVNFGVKDKKKAREEKVKQKKLHDERKKLDAKRALRNAPAGQLAAPSSSKPTSPAASTANTNDIAPEALAQVEKTLDFVWPTQFKSLRPSLTVGRKDGHMDPENYRIGIGIEPGVTDLQKYWATRHVAHEHNHAFRRLQAATLLHRDPAAFAQQVLQNRKVDPIASLLDTSLTEGFQQIRKAPAFQLNQLREAARDNELLLIASPDVRKVAQDVFLAFPPNGLTDTSDTDLLTAIKQVAPTPPKACLDDMARLGASEGSFQRAVLSTLHSLRSTAQKEVGGALRSIKARGLEDDFAQFAVTQSPEQVASALESLATGEISTYSLQEASNTGSFSYWLSPDEILSRTATYDALAHFSESAPAGEFFKFRGQFQRDCHALYDSARQALKQPGKGGLKSFVNTVSDLIRPGETGSQDNDGIFTKFVPIPGVKRIALASEMHPVREFVLATQAHLQNRH